MSTVRTRRDGRVLYATLDRPQALNSMNPELVVDLRRVIAESARDDGLGVLVIEGDERAFCAGADLAFVRGVFDDRARFHAYVHSLNEMMFELEASPLVTLAAIRGYAVAGGLELLLACDLALAADDAKIGDQHANYGLMPGAGGSQRLVRQIGLQAARELLFTGRWMSGTEAAAAGLVLRSHPSAELAGAVAELAGTIAAKSRAAGAYTKRAVNRGMDLPLPYAMDQEVFSLFEYFSSSPDPREGLEAFAAKRAPVFRR
jgi:enoyl-CoA hydratase/carnithine racemase